MKIGCKIESVVGVNFKKLQAKIVRLGKGTRFESPWKQNTAMMSNFFLLYLNIKD